MTLVAIDGHHNLHRILHVPAFKEFHQSGGQFTGGVYGGIVTIRSVLENFNAKHCVVVWDEGFPGFRKALVPSYKTNREPKNEEQRKEKEEHTKKFVVQRKLLTHLLKLLGVTVLECSGMEGDDLLYWVVQHHPASSKIIVSEDMDLAQLVGDGVRLWRPGKETMVTEENFKEIVGVRKERYVLKKALMGDTSDNVPGIKGVGDKRATTAIEELDDPSVGLVEFLPEFRRRCEGHKSAPIKRIAAEFAKVGRNLMVMDLANARWVDQAHVLLDDAMCHPSPFDESAVRQMFQDLGFTSLLENFSAWVQPFRMLKRN